VVYGLIISIFFYKDLTFGDLPDLLLSAFQTSAVVLLVIGATGCLSWLMTVEQVATQLAEWVKSVAHQQWVFLLLTNVALLLLGTFIEPLPAMLLSAPLLLPLARSFNIDMVHFGVVMTANLSIALYTPPVGGTLFVAANLAKAGIGEITRHLIPLMAATVSMLLVITYFPGLTKVILWVLAR
jgi:C4-dicarboxylate transporter, DctM subunit